MGRVPSWVLSVPTSISSGAARCTTSAGKFHSNQNHRLTTKLSFSDKGGDKGDGNEGNGSGGQPNGGQNGNDGNQPGGGGQPEESQPEPAEQPASEAPAAEESTTAK